MACTQPLRQLHFHKALSARHKEGRCLSACALLPSQPPGITRVGDVILAAAAASYPPLSKPCFVFPVACMPAVLPFTTVAFHVSIFIQPPCCSHSLSFYFFTQCTRVRVDSRIHVFSHLGASLQGSVPQRRNCPPVMGSLALTVREFDGFARFLFLFIYVNFFLPLSRRFQVRGTGGRRPISRWWRLFFEGQFLPPFCCKLCVFWGRRTSIWPFVSFACFFFKFRCQNWIQWKRFYNKNFQAFVNFFISRFNCSSLSETVMSWNIVTNSMRYERLPVQGLNV